MMWNVEGKIFPRDWDWPWSCCLSRSFWFSIVTMTTIGYGDVTPTTSLGKVLAIMFGIVGIVCVALLTANILEANAKFNEIEPSGEI